MYKYITIKESFEHPEIGTYTSYGIKAFYKRNEIMSVSDISTDKAFVENLARCCTKLQLDPIHLFDVVEDVIS